MLRPAGRQQHYSEFMKGLRGGRAVKIIYVKYVTRKTFTHVLCACGSPKTTRHIIQRVPTCVVTEPMHYTLRLRTTYRWSRAIADDTECHCSFSCCRFPARYRKVWKCLVSKTSPANLCFLTESFSMNPINAVRSISIGCPLRSYRAITKWKKFDLRKLLGGCFSKFARPMLRLTEKRIDLDTS